MKEKSSAVNSEPGEEGGGSLSELTSFVIKGHNTCRPETLHVVVLRGSGGDKQCERKKREREEGLSGISLQRGV